MILWTIAEYENVFPRSKAAEGKTVPLAHGFLELVRQGEQYAVSRLISTDPKDYLNPVYSPRAAYRP